MIRKTLSPGSCEDSTGATAVLRFKPARSLHQDEANAKGRKINDGACTELTCRVDSPKVSLWAILLGMLFESRLGVNLMGEELELWWMDARRVWR